MSATPGDGADGMAGVSWVEVTVAASLLVCAALSALEGNTLI